MKRNESKLNASETVPARGRSETFSVGRVQVSLLRAEDAGVDCDEPWIASCDTHGCMLACATKRLARLAVRNEDRREWCGGCEKSHQEKRVKAIHFKQALKIARNSRG